MQVFSRQKKWRKKWLKQAKIKQTVSEYNLSKDLQTITFYSDSIKIVIDSTEHDSGIWDNLLDYTILYTHISQANAKVQETFTQC